MEKRMVQPRFVLCVRYDDCEDLEVRKVYQVIPDEGASKEGCIRVIDESGEDYLYPGDYFIPIEIPRSAEQVFFVTP
jgi:hypothetical protein